MAEEPKPSPTPSGKPGQSRNIRDITGELLDATGKWFEELVDLGEGLDKEGAIVTIKTNKRMRGANAWMLMCSIMIASLGLDLGSPAIIIGAMLISPLMSPILGIGLGVAINDREALFIALRHFGIAMMIAIFTSTLYFLITPLGQLTEEIQARTAPSFLDGLVAVFGGLAGIISTTRKQGSNAIPGVAIATALMPPLCVTGFGLANQNWGVTLNSFYLFFLNSFFIALTAFLIIRFLNFPYRTHMNPMEARRTRWVIALFSVIIIVPSGFILYNLYKEQQDRLKVEQFIGRHFGPESSTRALNYSLMKRDTNRQLIFELLGDPIPDDSLVLYRQELANSGLPNLQLSVIQDKDLGLDQINRMQLEISNLEQLADNLQTVQKVKSEQERRIEELQHRIDSLRADTIAFEQIVREARVLFSGLESTAYARARKTNYKTSTHQLPLFLVEWSPSKSRTERRRDEEKLHEFLKLRTGLDTLQIVSY